MKSSKPIGFEMFLAAVVMILASGTTSGARAEVIARYQSSPWLVEANASNGEFQNCTMSADQARGAKVLIVLTPGDKWAIGVMNPGFNLKPGAAGQVSYWVDDVIPRGGAAKAIDGKTLLAPLENAPQLFEEFRLGSMMNVKVGNETLQFSLNGTSAALATLIGCSRRHAEQAQAPR